MKAHFQQAATTETILFACKIGQPDYMEEILYQCKGYVNKDELMKKSEVWAKENGYNRLRLTTINLNEKPDFIGSINLKKG